MVLLSVPAAASCLLIYNYIISHQDGGIAARRALVTRDLPGGSAGRYRDPMHPSRTLLFGGRHDGHICVYNWDTGNVDYSVEVRASVKFVCFSMNFVEYRVCLFYAKQISEICPTYPKNCCIHFLAVWLIHDNLIMLHAFFMNVCRVTVITALQT